MRVSNPAAATFTHPVAYVQKSDIVPSEIVEAFFVEHTDDNGDGVEDAGIWDAIAAAASRACDDLLSRRYLVPFSSPPPLVRQAAAVFALETLHNRRGRYGDENPYGKRADKFRTQLHDIAGGNGSLEAASETAPGANEPGGASADFISRPSRLRPGML